MWQTVALGARLTLDSRGRDVLIRKLSALVAVAAATALALPTLAAGDPAGRTTLDEVIRINAGSGFQLLHSSPGERYLVRTALAEPRSGRKQRRRSLVFFGQLTDPQLADEMTPPRLDFLDEAGPPLQDGVRPQETMGTHLFDWMIRNMNANPTSRVKAEGDANRRAAEGVRDQLDFVINTGDMADSQQLNEVRWIIDLLEGRMVDPFSGKPTTTSQCSGADQDTVNRLNADVAAREYTGLQDYDDYADAPDARKRAFYDPDEAPPGGTGPYADWPRYPGLLNRAQMPFQAEGLGFPWYTARGNHDGLVTGNVYATFGLARGLITGCRKIFPSSSFDPNIYAGMTESEVFEDIVNNPSRQAQILGGARFVPPDSDRRYVDQREYRELHRTGDKTHGYGYVDKGELQRSNGMAMYYGFNRNGFRFISLDTVAEGGGSDGNVDHSQYKWLKKELDRNSSIEYRDGRLRRDDDEDRLIVVYSHHKLEDLTITNEDEDAGECGADYDPGCDRDPRDSTPLHRGLTGPSNIRDLFLRYPNVIAFVTGHSHENEIKPFRRSDGTSGFWQINTASHTDFPQQSRQIQVMDNEDGTLSIWNTILDSAAPVGDVPPFGTPAALFSHAQLGALGRLFSANDPQGLGPKGPGSRRDEGRGGRFDRNVELLLPHPERLQDGTLIPHEE